MLSSFLSVNGIKIFSFTCSLLFSIIILSVFTSITSFSEILSSDIMSDSLIALCLFSTSSSTFIIFSCVTFSIILSSFFSSFDVLLFLLFATISFSIVAFLFYFSIVISFIILFLEGVLNSLLYLRL